MTDSADRLIRALAASAEVEPHPALDRRVRALLSGRGSAARPILRPFTALGLSAASLLALVVALALVLAGAGAAEQGPSLALLLTVAYLAVSSAATVPLLLLPEFFGNIPERIRRFPSVNSISAVFRIMIRWRD